MKIDFEVNLQVLDECPIKDGQISVKLPKDQEIRYKVLNTRHSKKLSVIMRDFALKLMDEVEAHEEESQAS